MAKKPDRVYTVTAELRVAIAPNSLVAEADEAVVAAVRHRMRFSLERVSRSGVRFVPGHTHVEVKKLEELTNE